MKKQLTMICFLLAGPLPANQSEVPVPFVPPTKSSAKLKWYTSEFKYLHQTGPHIGFLKSRVINLINDVRLYRAPDLKSGTFKFHLRSGQRLILLDRIPGEGISPQHRTTWYHVRANRREGWLPDAYITAEPVTRHDPQLGNIGLEPVDRIHGLAPDYAPLDLVKVAYGYNRDRVYYLRREVASALEAMFSAARRDGLELYLISAYRSWPRQQAIYERKVKGSEDGIHQRTVAKPGHSEHQLGTAVDLNGEEQDTLLRRSFGDTEEGRWLSENAPEYGFALSYTSHNERLTGYSPEPWHYRYWGRHLARIRHDAALGIESGELAID